MSHGSPAAASRTPEESVTRAADIARRYGQDSAADRAVQMLNATFRAGTVVVVGEVKRGKSSLVNALIAQPDLLPVDVLTCTSAPIRVAVSHDGPIVPQVTLVRGTEREMILATELARWVTVDGVGALQGNTNAGMDEAQDPPGDGRRGGVTTGQHQLWPGGGAGSTQFSGDRRTIPGHGRHHGRRYARRGWAGQTRRYRSTSGGTARWCSAHGVRCLHPLPQHFRRHGTPVSCSWCAMPPPPSPRLKWTSCGRPTIPSAASSSP